VQFQKSLPSVRLYTIRNGRGSVLRNLKLTDDAPRLHLRFSLSDEEMSDNHGRVFLLYYFFACSPSQFFLFVTPVVCRNLHKTTTFSMLKTLILSTLALALALPAAAFAPNQGASPFGIRTASGRFHSSPVADAPTESSEVTATDKLRNIAVIAHVDHGT
jgi:hypothetical protein